MPLAIKLLGRPSITSGEPGHYRLRSRKSWGLIAHLILREHPPSRTQLASLLFGDAEDPMRALRWSLSEIRRGLGDDASVEGDPVVLELPADAVVDIDVITRGSWAAAVVQPGLGEVLLEGMTIRDAAAFESWLLSEQRHVAAATEAILHEAALSLMSHGELDAATRHAVGLVSLNPLDENHQALLIRLYRMAGDNEAAERQLTACTELFERELGVDVGPGISAAMREPTRPAGLAGDDAAIDAVLEAGAAAVSAGAVEPGVRSLRSAVAMADGADSTRLRVTARLALAEALIHSLRGQDEEGTAILHGLRRSPWASTSPGWPPRPKGTPRRPSIISPMRGCAAIGSPTRTSGSTCTSSTLSAAWDCFTITRRSGRGSTACTTSRHEPR